MHKKLILILCFCLFQQGINAQQTNSYFLTTTAATSISITTAKSTLSANINSDTGLLSAALNPSFTILTNSSQTYYLTFSATTTTTSGSTNAIFNVGTTKYIILTNNTVLPAVSSVNNIKTTTPTASSNPNAIAYQINDPPTQTGLAVSYNSTNKNWLLTLNRSGATTTSITIPASTPFSNTFSGVDEAGNYRATITLSFNDE